MRRCSPSAVSPFSEKYIQYDSDFLGTRIYAKVKGVPYESISLRAIFSTSLAPLVSEVAFVSRCALGESFEIPVGSVSVWSLSLAVHKSFHEGLNIYNSGFAAGILGLLFAGILRMFRIPLEPHQLVSSGNNDLLAPVLYGIAAF